MYGELYKWFYDNITIDDMKHMTQNEFIGAIAVYFDEKYNWAVEEIAKEYYNENIRVEYWGQEHKEVNVIRDSLGRFISWWLEG